MLLSRVQPYPPKGLLIGTAPVTVLHECFLRSKGPAIEISRLRGENERLQERVRQAELIISVQKKVAHLWIALGYGIKGVVLERVLKSITPFKVSGRKWRFFVLLLALCWPKAL
jgi:hypothetical protein